VKKQDRGSRIEAPRRKFVKTGKAVGGLLVLMPFLWLGVAPVVAQTYPSKPVRFVLPFPPGGPTDILGRIVGQKLAEALGQPVVVDNRGGAGGNVGTEFASKQPADGYNIALVSPALVYSPSLYKKLGYDPVRDFAPISLVAQIPNVLLIHPSVPARTLKDLVQLAKANPGKLNFGSGGLGTGQHLAGETLKVLANVNMVHVPYKGSNLAMLAMIGGEIDMVVIGIPPALQQIQSGRVRALAILAAQRSPALPNVPTAAEAGMPGYEVSSWYGVVAPAGTPREIVSRLNAELTKSMHSADGRERIVGAGFDPMTRTPEQFAAFIKTELARGAKIIQAAGIKPE
jgi:tripartite-type tricarboxylate transporter receptor subunit TctC